MFKKLTYPIILFLVANTVFLSSCKEDPIPVIPPSTEDLSFLCPVETSDIFMEAYIGGDLFCYYDGIAAYEMNTSITAGFSTPTATTSTNPDSEEVSNFRVWGNMGFRPNYDEIDLALNGQPMDHLKHHIFIQTPNNPEQITLRELISKHITAEGELPLRSNLVADTTGFNVEFRYNDNWENRSEIFETGHGPQDDSFLEITSLDIQRLPDFTIYDVTFEFACNLYYYREPHALWKRVEDGKMHLVFQM